MANQNNKPTGPDLSDGVAVADLPDGVMVGGHIGGEAVLLALGRRSRTASVIGGLLTLAGSATLRQCVFRAGFQSAQDPKYTVDSQRRGA